MKKTVQLVLCFILFLFSKIPASANYTQLIDNGFDDPLLLVGFDDPLLLNGFDDPLLLNVIVKMVPASGDPAATQYTSVLPLPAIPDTIHLTGLPLPTKTTTFDDPLLITSLSSFDDPLLLPALFTNPAARSNAKAALTLLNRHITRTSLGYNILLFTLEITTDSPISYPVMASTMDVNFPGNPGYPPPGSISYQGKLSDGSGPVNGPVAMTFRIYDAETAGSLLYEEEHGVVPVDDGVYNAHIGGGTDTPNGTYPDLKTAVLSSAVLWLEVAVNGDTLTPRNRITPTATAILANEADFAVDADRVDGKHAADFALKSELGIPGSGAGVDWGNLANVPADIANGDDVNDADNNPSNELQTLGLEKNILSINPGGNTVDLSDTGRLAGLLCADGEVVKSRNNTWGCGKDIETANPDNLGNHTATTNIILGSNYLSGDGDDEGIQIDSLGRIGIGSLSPGAKLHVANPDVAQAAYFKNDNAANNLPTLYANTNGSGQAIFALNQGTGPAGHFQILNPASNAPVLLAETNGTGYAGEFRGDVGITGKVGIGTVAPTEALQVEGGLKVNTINAIYNRDPTYVANIAGTLCPCDVSLYDETDCPVNYFLSEEDLGATCINRFQLSAGSFAHYQYSRSTVRPLIKTNRTDSDVNVDIVGQFSVNKISSAPDYSYSWNGILPGHLEPRCSCDIDPGDPNATFSDGTTPRPNGADCADWQTNQNEGAECYDWYQTDYAIYPDLRPYSRRFERSGLSADVALFVDKQGRVGVGTSSPGSALHVVGNIYATGTVTELSDRRLKENITPITDALQMVEAINGVYYNKIAAPDKTEAGVIAQDVQQVLPEAVSEIDSENGYLGVSYDMLIPVLIEAVKELKSENDSLKSLVCQDHPGEAICL